MKTDYLNAKILSHRANLQRYATLLATQLTELEREYLHKRIEEERAEVASLEFARAAEAAQAKETVTVPNPFPPHASPPVRRILELQPIWGTPRPVVRTIRTGACRLGTGGTAR